MIQDKEKITIAIIACLFGFILAFVLFPRPEFETVYKTEIKTETDTVFVSHKDTIYVPKTKIKMEVLRDTVLIDFEPKISQFNATFPFEHGSTSVSGEVLGEVLKMTATNDFKIPVVTNTITETKTQTILVKPKGIYLGGVVNSNLDPGLQAAYLDNKYLFTYQFQPVTRIHTLGVAKKLF